MAYKFFADLTNVSQLATA